MAKKKKRKKQRRARRPRRQNGRSAEPTPSIPQEERGAEAVTVGWVIATFTALLAQVVAVVVVYMEFADGPGTAGSLLVELMLFVAKFSGGIALLATPVVYVVRSKRPPLAITVAVVIVALTPWVISGSPA